MMKFIKNLLTGPDGESLSIGKLAALLIVLVCCGIMITEAVWLFGRKGALISDWALLNTSLAVFIPAFCTAAIGLITLQSSNEGGLLKAHGIPPTVDAPEKE